MGSFVHRISILSIAVSTLVSVANAAPVTFSDGTFSDPDWTLSDYTIGGGGVSSATQQVVGGNPGAFREVTTSIPAGGGERRVFSFNFRNGALYDPQAQTAIASIDYSEDAIIFSLAQTVGPAIRQNGMLYAFEIISTFTGTTWTPVSQNLKSEDFDLFGPGGVDATQHPDFSASGLPIEFGFIRGLGAPAGSAPGGATSIGGIDNWSVAVNAVPVPSALPLFGSAMAVLGFIRWRQSKAA